MLIVDTGPLVAYLNRNDPDHVRCAQLLESRTDDLLITPYVVTETCYLVVSTWVLRAEINVIEALLKQRQLVFVARIVVNGAAGTLKVDCVRRSRLPCAQPCPRVGN